MVKPSFVKWGQSQRSQTESAMLVGWGVPQYIYDPLFFVTEKLTELQHRLSQIRVQRCEDKWSLLLATPVSHFTSGDKAPRTLKLRDLVGRLSLGLLVP